MNTPEYLPEPSPNDDPVAVALNRLAYGNSYHSTYGPVIAVRRLANAFKKNPAEFLRTIAMALMDAEPGIRPSIRVDFPRVEKKWAGHGLTYGPDATTITLTIEDFRIPPPPPACQHVNAAVADGHRDLIIVKCPDCDMHLTLYKESGKWEAGTNKESDRP